MMELTIILSLFAIISHCRLDCKFEPQSSEQQLCERGIYKKYTMDEIK